MLLWHALSVEKSSIYLLMFLLGHMPTLSVEHAHDAVVDSMS